MSTLGERVFLLWHVHQTEEDDTEKLLGVYSSEERAKQRIEQALTLPGFRDLPEGFEIVPYKVDVDEWLEGYVSDGGLDLPAWMARSVNEAESDEA